VQIAHKNNAEKRKWEHKDLLPGSWGYDALAITICGALETYCLCAAERLAEKQTLCEMAAAIHLAWREIYIFWRDNKPQERQDVNYTPPYSPLGDKKRDDLSMTAYSYLAPEEKEKDNILAEFIYQEVTNSCGQTSLP
jgi:hypothetical protein